MILLQTNTVKHCSTEFRTVKRIVVVQPERNVENDLPARITFQYPFQSLHVSSCSFAGPYTEIIHIRSRYKGINGIDQQRIIIPFQISNIKDAE